ncbi:pinensin family lanthipeptide [Longimicrobium terrae]|uniref:Uncharacterized protein n=1 Tax=Longimicrobium terrae TaxID=1639882 RepID=A0A841H0G2_9BACT|nr:pinensin family lanthipeptide [Longimicrobium terrae]MBB4637188.1 hypothetical protein [Longimicrobium terrae]MBB6071551.1 hypothetical protein [Longimicrobium terrae]NNC30030.1 hypothetical protein [Longimicrobium terrae]
MRKLKLEIDDLAVESFTPSVGEGEAGTVRANITAYYELCHADQTAEATCTCEPTCNAQTCYNCSAACGSARCTGGCNTTHELQTIVLTNCDLCFP